MLKPGQVVVPLSSSYYITLISIFSQVAGGTKAVPKPTWLASTLRRGQELVANKSSIITEEREVWVSTVGQKRRCCFCPTELLLPLSSSSDLCKDIVKTKMWQLWKFNHLGAFGSILALGGFLWQTFSSSHVVNSLCSPVMRCLITKQLSKSIESDLIWCCMKAALSKLGHFWGKCSNIIHKYSSVNYDSLK